MLVKTKKCDIIRKKLGGTKNGFKRNKNRS